MGLHALGTTRNGGCSTTVDLSYVNPPETWNSTKMIDPTYTRTYETFVWHLGISLFELFQGFSPFSGFKSETKYFDDGLLDDRMFKYKIGEKLKLMLKFMISKDSNKRYRPGMLTKINFK